MNLSKIKPVGHRVVLKSTRVENTKKVGDVTIYTSTDSEAERQAVGNHIHEVVALGPQAYKHKDFKGPWCEVGDKVITSQYPGQKMKLDDCIVWFVNDEDILAKVEQ